MALSSRLSALSFRIHGLRRDGPLFLSGYRLSGGRLWLKFLRNPERGGFGWRRSGLTCLRLFIRLTFPRARVPAPHNPMRRRRWLQKPWIAMRLCWRRFGDGWNTSALLQLQNWERCWGCRRRRLVRLGCRSKRAEQFSGGNFGRGAELRSA